MHWFGGSMAEAVTLSKQRNAIFVVFVEGDNDLSKELSTTIDDGDVLKRLTDPNNFLAVKLKSGSENYTYFAQIYQFVPVPSLFFIGRNGTPLEVVCAGVAAPDLATRIDRILQEHRKDQKSSTVQPSTSSQNVKSETVNFLQSEANATTAQSVLHPGASESAPKVPESAPKVPESAPKVPDSVPKSTESASKCEETAPKLTEVSRKSPAPVDEGPESSSAPAAKIQKTQESSKAAQEYEVVCDGDVCVRRPITDAGPSGGTAAPVTESESNMSTEEKMERAKELIEARRREKAEKDKELEKEKEKERRALGQGVAELKKWQAEQEMKQIQEERKRERMENNMARQRILEQIAQDRAERRARDQPPAPPTTPPTASPAAPVGDGAGRARVQFKLPDGAAHTTHFDASASIADVHRYVADNLQMSRSSFSLWTAFPRRELTENDATLRELQLAPSAALLVLPRRTDTVAARPSPFASVISFFTQLFSTLILDPSYQLYSWLRGRLFPTPPPTPPSDPPSTPTPNPTSVQGLQGVRRRGNIHRLTGEADDDNNTWNGNSTQQM